MDKYFTLLKISLQSLSCHFNLAQLAKMSANMLRIYADRHKLRLKSFRGLCVVSWALTKTDKGEVEGALAFGKSILYMGST